MREFYLSIAGLILKITILPHRNLHYSEKIIDNCLNNFNKFFIEKTKIKNVDFEIIVEDRIETYKFIKNKKQKSIFYASIISKRIDKRKLIVYSHVSFIQFHWIIEQLIYELLPKHNGFIFHSSAVVINNKAYVFSADDGGGKSTVMSFLKTMGVPVADDTSIIKKINSDYLLFSSPFRAKNFNLLKIKNEGYPIKSIFILKKAKFFKIEKIDKSKALGFLSKQIKSNQDSYKNSLRIFLNFMELFNNFFYLFFNKDEEKFNNFFSKKLNQYIGK